MDIKDFNRANVIKEEIDHQETRFLALYVEAKNSIMVMLSEKEDRLGTLAIAVPKPQVGAVTSSVMLGDKHVISARMFAEYVAGKKGKIAVVSVFLEKMTEIQAQEFFMHLIDKVMKTDYSKKEPEAI